MEPRQEEQKKTPVVRQEADRKRPRFRPEVERLEERISLSGLGHGHGHTLCCKGW
jgi:hypothetical protein